MRINTLTEDDKGRYVLYKTNYCQQRGRIKSWNDEVVFVVYNCNQDWENYKNYTAQATDPEDLIFI